MDQMYAIAPEPGSDNRVTSRHLEGTAAPTVMTSVVAASAVHPAAGQPSRARSAVKYVLDTDVVARLLDNDARVATRFAAVAADSVGMPLVVLAELLFGVEKSSRREQNRARLERFAAGARVLHFDVAVAARYAAVRAEVERKGRSKTGG